MVTSSSPAVPATPTGLTVTWLPFTPEGVTTKSDGVVVSSVEATAQLTVSTPAMLSSFAYSVPPAVSVMGAPGAPYVTPSGERRMRGEGVGICYTQWPWRHIPGSPKAFGQHCVGPLHAAFGGRQHVVTPAAPGLQMPSPQHHGACGLQ